MGQQTPAVGKDESLLLRLCPGVHAAPLGSPVLRPEQIGSDLGDGFLLSSLSPPSMFAILSHIRGGALPKGRPKVLKDHTLLRFSMCRWRQTRLLGHAMRSAGACRHRSHRIFRIKRELLLFDLLPELFNRIVVRRIGPYRRERAITPHFLYHIATQAFSLSCGEKRKFPLSAGTGRFNTF